MFGEGDSTTVRTEFKIDKIELLEEMFKNYATGIKITVDSRKLSEDFVKTITSSAKKNKGTCNVTFIVFDPQNNVSVTLEGKKYGVDVSSFITDIRPMVKKGDIYDYTIQTRNV